MKRLLIILCSNFISGCGTYYTTTNYIEKNNISDNSGYFSPSKNDEWLMYDNKNNSVNPESKNKNNYPKIMKVQFYLNNQKQESYLWYGSIDSEHSDTSNFTSLTPTNLIYLINLADFNKEYTLKPGEYSNGGVISEQPFRTKDELKHLSVNKSDEVRFIKLEDYIIDDKNSWEYRKNITKYGLFGSGMYSSSLKFSVDRTYKKIILKAYSSLNKSEVNFESDYIQIE